MISSKDIKALASVTKNLVTDQTFSHIHKKLNTAVTAFNGSLGFGAADANSSAVFVDGGGFNDQRMTAVMRFVSPTVAASCSLGAFIRCQTLDTNPSYYWARVDGGVARITKVLSGTFSTLSSNTFALPQNEDVTITFSAVGTVLSASFVSASGSAATVNLVATDSSIAGTGLMGFRSLVSSIYCTSFTAEQL